MSIRGTAVSRVSTSGAQGEADIVAQFRARHLELVRLAALLHGSVHGGGYHSLAPAFPLSYPGGLYQVTW